MCLRQPGQRARRFLGERTSALEGDSEFRSLRICSAIPSDRLRGNVVRACVIRSSCFAPRRVWQNRAAPLRSTRFDCAKSVIRHRMCPSLSVEKPIRKAFSSALSNYDVGDRLIQCFSDAGLPQPQLFCEIPIWCGADAPCRWLADTLRSLPPQLHRMGIALEDVLAIDALENQPRDAIGGSSQPGVGSGTNLRLGPIVAP